MKNIQVLFSTLLVLTFWSAQTRAQFKPMGNGLKGYVLCSYAHGNDVYMATSSRSLNPDDPVTDYDTVQVSRWDGYTWDNFPKLIIYSANHEWKRNEFEDRVYDMEIFNGELYVAGSFDEIVGIPHSKGIVRFPREKGWEEVDGGMKWEARAGNVHSLEVYKDRLYVGGTFTGAGPITASDIASWDGTFWRYVGSSPAEQGFGGNGNLHDVTDLLVYKDELYALGNLGTAPGLDLMGYIPKWDGKKWSKFLVPATEKYTLGTLFNDHLVLAMQSAYPSMINKERWVMEWDGNEWTSLRANMEYTSDSSTMYSGGVSDIMAHGGKLWMAGSFADHDWNAFCLAVWDGKLWKAFDNYPKSSYLWSNLNINILAKTANGLYTGLPYKDVLRYNPKDNLILNYVAQIAGRAALSGKVYIDENKDCKPNPGEAGLSNYVIEFNSGQFYAITDENGNYSTYLDSGITTAHIIPKNHWSAACPEKDIEITVKDKDVVSDVNFSVKPDVVVTDLRLNLTGSEGWRARGGFIQTYTLTCENVGTKVIDNADIHLTHDALLGQFTSNPPANSYKQREAIWHISDLIPGQRRVITFSLRSDPQSSGKSVRMYAFLDPSTNSVDTFPDDNRDSLIQEIRAAHDPNDKQCYPAGNIKPGTKELRYHIRFQNTGNDTAYKVEVVDTIDVNLPLTKIYVNSASHPYELKIEGNVLRWIFRNINLPDSNTNEPLSHGYINYSAIIKPGLAVGTEIKNTAYIYFDYQLPVETNKTRSKIMDPEWGNQGIADEGEEDASLKIYPNPARDRVTINNTDTKKHRVTLVNMLGKEMATVELQPMQIQEIPLRQYAAGIYFLRNEDGQARKLLITK